MKSQYYRRRSHGRQESRWKKGWPRSNDTPLWKANPALLVIKPHHGLIVSLESIEHDERYFALAFAVEEAMVAPEAFDTQIPIKLRRVWNQPYMSLGADCISAPYSFYLHFGARGANSAQRQLLRRCETVRCSL